MDLVNNANIIDRIKARAKVKGIKLKFISDKLGVANTYFADVANGKNSLKEERLYKIAELLDTTVEYLKGETDNSESTEIKVGEIKKTLPDTFLETVMEVSQLPNGDVYIDALLDRAKQILEEEKEHQEKIKKLL